MKAVILAGGFGTRLSEETLVKPKPMIEIGGMPILWHIMKMYSHYGINSFVICCGYKGYMIKEYFANYFLHNSDITIDLRGNLVKFHSNNIESWTVTLVDTGPKTMTAGRLKRVRKYLEEDEFCFSYGDGVGDVDIGKLLDFHHSHGKQATLTAVQPPGKYGALKLDATNRVEWFREKPDGDGSWINGGFFVLNPSVIDLIESDDCSWEEGPLVHLASKGELMAFKHSGFWQPMDTLRDMRILNQLWEQKDAPWKVWE